MPNNSGEYKLIRAGRLIDGRGGSPIDGGLILIQGSKILAVGTNSNIALPEGAKCEIFDFSNKTIMPGMVDCHTHHNGFGDGRPADELADIPDEILTLQSVRNARASLFTGVTSFRENGPKNKTMFRLREAIRENREIGPRMVLCGRPLAIIGGHMSYFGSTVTGLTEARAVTRQLIKEGADYIKITATGGTTKTSQPLHPSFNVDELNAITDEAHKFGKLTATHCVSTQGIINSLDANVDMIIHCVFMEANGSEIFREDVAERIGQKGVFVNPTLHVVRSKAWAMQHKKHPLTTEEQQELDECNHTFDVRLEHCQRLISMGLKVITGSDSSWSNYQLGNTPYETECLVMAGMSPMQGIVSVTGEAASAIGINNVVGTLENDKEADIIVLDRDPTEDVRNLFSVTDVFLAGQRIDRGSVDSLDTIRQMPPSV